MDEQSLTPTSDLLMDSGRLRTVLRHAQHLLEWEGADVVPEGPEEALVDYLADHLSAGGLMAPALLYAFRRLYGASVARLDQQVQRYAAVVEAFEREFGSGPVAVIRAPARINILGEHVDYVTYLPTEVLPFASREHDMLMVFRPAESGRVRGRSTLAGAEPAEFVVDEGPRNATPEDALADAWLQFLQSVGAPHRHWINYVKASVFFCALRHGVPARGFDFLIDSTLPAAGGASSSSAVVVLSGAAVRLANGLPCDREALAQDSAKAEWYIGTRGGNMDHCTMCLARRQNALHLNFSPFHTELTPLHRYRYRWVAFFSHPADKSGDVLLKYNERSAVSRLLIPALLERLCGEDPALRARWDDAVRTLSDDREDTAAARSAQEVVARLPESVTLDEVRRDFPRVYTALERGYPRLAQTLRAQPLPIRARALHHVGEVRRVREAVRIFREVFAARAPEAPEKTEPALRAAGDLITEAHESLRDLYQITTREIDELVDILLSHPGVYGARLMGGGFGGNVLALVSKDHVAELVDRVQRQYYGPRRRDGLAEGSVMVSTPGEGIGAIRPGEILRRAIINASAIWWKWERYAPVIERAVCELLRLPALSAFRPVRPIQPVIVAAGRGDLRQEGDYRTPAALNVLDGRTSLEHVLAAIGAMPFPTHPPVLVISPAMRGAPIEGIPLPPDTRIVIQEAPLGTGHAMLSALPAVAASGTDVLVVWGSQPLLTAATLSRSITVHQALDANAMLFPTAVTRAPYAPIQRDLRGFVIASRETSAEDAPTKRLGETNVGAFVLSAELLHATLKRVHETLWRPAEGRYATRSGELGFPNEMARALVRAGRPVIALPIARPEESLGLRTRAGFEEVKRLLAR